MHKHWEYDNTKEMQRRGFFVSTAIAIGTAVGIGGAGFAAGAVGYGLLGAAAYGATKAVGAIAGGQQGSGVPALPGLPAPPSRDSAIADAKAGTAKKRASIARNKSTYTSPLG